MRSKRRNTNIKILQSQIQNLVVDSKEPLNEVKLPIAIKRVEPVGTGVELPIVEKLPKKRGIKKDELINTKRLLTM